MHALTQLIHEDMKPALGVTEPGAIALAVSTACRHLPEKPEKVELFLNSGIYKNAFTCGIPGTSHVGNAYAAALGALAADPDKGLLCLDGITDEDVKAAEAMVKAGKIAVHMSEITSRISIEARVAAGSHSASCLIRDAHTNIVKVTEDGRTVLDKTAGITEAEGEEQVPVIHRYTLAQLADYARTVPLKEIAFIREAGDGFPHCSYCGHHVRCRLRPGVPEGRGYRGHDKSPQQHGQFHYRHDLRRRQPGLRHERHDGSGNGLRFGSPGHG